MTDQKKDLRCYYAHSMMTYNTQREQEELQILRKLYARVICPNNDIGDCSKGMQAYLNIVSWADVVVVSEYEDCIGAGVFTEVCRALNSQIPVLCMHEGDFYPVSGVTYVDRQDQQVRYAQLICEE